MYSEKISYSCWLTQSGRCQYSVLGFWLGYLRIAGPPLGFPHCVVLEQSKLRISFFIYSIATDLRVNLSRDSEFCFIFKIRE